MLQICFGTDLVLAVPALLLILAALAAAKQYDMAESRDRQRHYQITSPVGKRQNTQSQYGKRQDLLEDPSSL